MPDSLLPNAVAFEADVTQDAHFSPLFDAIAAGQGGMPEILVNNAGFPDAQRARKMNRLGDPAQMESTLLYLVAPASEFVTGTCIKIDDAQGGR